MISSISTVKSIYENDDDILYFRQKKIFSRLLLILLVGSLVPYIVILIVFGFFYFNGWISLGHSQGVSSPAGWLVFFGTFSFLCAVATLSLAILIKALKISGREFKLLIKNLEKEQQRLKEKLIQAERLKALGY